MQKPKKPTNIKDIAKIANTSTATISYFLNNKKNKMSAKTWEKIDKVIKQNNYRPTNIARQLRTKQSNIVGIIVGNISQRFSNILYESVSNNIEKNQYILSLFSSKLENKKELEIVLELLSQNVAYIVIQASSQFEKNFKKISDFFPEAHKKIIIVDSYKKNSKFRHVYHDSSKSVDQFIKSSKDKFNKILFITEKVNLLDVRVARVVLFKEAAKKYNIPFVEIEFNDNFFDKSIFINKIKNIDFEDTLFCCNNEFIAKQTLLSLKDHFGEKKENGFKLLSYNKCPFSSLTKANITIIDTKTWKIGESVTSIIQGNSKEKDIKIQTDILEYN